jgi:hypothetical protein
VYQSGHAIAFHAHPQADPHKSGEFKIPVSMNWYNIMDLITGMSAAYRTDRQQDGLQAVVVRAAAVPHRQSEDAFVQDARGLIERAQPLPFAEPPQQILDDCFATLTKLCLKAYKKCEMDCPPQVKIKFPVNQGWHDIGVLWPAIRRSYEDCKRAGQSDLRRLEKYVQANSAAQKELLLRSCGFYTFTMPELESMRTCVVAAADSTKGIYAKPSQSQLQCLSFAHP